MKLANLSTAAPVVARHRHRPRLADAVARPGERRAARRRRRRARNGGAQLHGLRRVEPGRRRFSAGSARTPLEQNADGVQLTYPGTTQITAPGACAVATGRGRHDHDRRPARRRSASTPASRRSARRLYSVTASTMTLPAAGEQRPVAGRRRRRPVQPDRRRPRLRRDAVTAQPYHHRRGYTRGDAGELDKLIALGLTSYEAKAYLALVRRDSFAAADVARRRGHPAPAHLRRAATLVQKGLAVAAARPAGQSTRRARPSSRSSACSQTGARSSSGSSADAAR